MLLEKLHPYQLVTEKIFGYLSLKDLLRLRQVLRIHRTVVDQKLATLEEIDVGQFFCIQKSLWQDKTSQDAQVRMIEKCLPATLQFFAEKSNVRS